HPRLHPGTRTWNFLHRYQGREGQGCCLVQWDIAALITDAHRSISLSIRAHSSSGDEPMGSINWVASFSRSIGWRMISATSLLIRSMIGPGVLAGAISPLQASASTSIPLSFSVGTSGK